VSQINIQHQVTLQPQHTQMTCWSAVVAMMLGGGFCAGSGEASMDSRGGLLPDEQNVAALARSYGLQMEMPQSWTVQGLANMLRGGPVGMFGAMPRRHAVLIAGMRSDGTPDTTTLTIYDPWPVGVGRIVQANYQTLMSTYPLATMYMLHH